MIVERFDRHGDIDEYNSPTYDGVDLWALALWVTHPPTVDFAASGAAILDRMGERISELFHPRFGTTCGPYIRAYGLDPRRYVSLAGLCSHLAGAPAVSVLPAQLRPDTVHVHDLYFLPVLARLAPAFTGRLDLHPVTAERRRSQHFTRSAAESLLRPDLAVGWERGRRHEASLDQYVPFSAHLDIDGEPAAIGLMLPAATAWIDVHRTGDLTFEFRAGARTDGAGVGLRIVTTSGADVTAIGGAFGPCEVEFDHPAAAVTSATTPIGHEQHVVWADGEIAGRVVLRR
jgi:hypothetical protein